MGFAKEKRKQWRRSESECLKNSGREGAQIDIKDPQMDRKPWKRQERICEKVRLITD